MTSITLKGNPINTCGTLPAVGSTALDFCLVKNDLSNATLASYTGKKKVLSVFPSIDTPVCATSVRKFNECAASLPDTIVLNISTDLPFAQKRFCAAEGISGVETLSAFRSTFAKDYGMKIVDGPLAELCSRAILVLDANNKVLYTEQVPEITQEPDYGKVLNALK